MAVRVLCVLKSGGDYRPEHVHALRVGLLKHWPDKHANIICLTDQRLSLFGVDEVPLVGGWPGWWSKLEAFRPDIPGDLLMIDLDTVFVGDLSDFASIGKLAIMRDVYRPKGLQSSIVYIPQKEKAAVWNRWLENPSDNMMCYRNDQEFLEPLWMGKAAIWQDELPGQLVSYKADVCRGTDRFVGVPKGARVVIYHGRPRPWDTQLWGR